MPIHSMAYKVGATPQQRAHQILECIRAYLAGGTKSVYLVVTCTLQEYSKKMTGAAGIPDLGERDTERKTLKELAALLKQKSNASLAKQVTVAGLPVRVMHMSRYQHSFLYGPEPTFKPRSAFLDGLVSAVEKSGVEVLLVSELSSKDAVESAACAYYRKLLMKDGLSESKSDQSRIERRDSMGASSVVDLPGSPKSLVCG